MKREDLEIVDGQQRIDSLYEFAEGAFSLFDPQKDDKIAKFPKFIKELPCEWAGKNYAELAPDLRQRFEDIQLPIVYLTTDSRNEVRDLFVRLQSGLPLNAQETRDAWPGQFTDFILWLGGKAGIARYPGHPFFTEVLGMKPGDDRGKTRQLAAQIALLYFSRRESKTNELPDINAVAINDFYYSHIDFEISSDETQRLIKILNKITELLRGGKRPKLKGHDAIHLVLLVDALWDDYTRGWEDSLPYALDKFMEQLALAKKSKDDEEPNEFWTKYAQWTRVNSDRGERIAYRHSFYAEKMLSWLGDLELKDPKRLFGELERQIIYFRRHKKCDVCGAAVMWKEAEIHHVAQHAKGGGTTLEMVRWYITPVIPRATQLRGNLHKNSQCAGKTPSTTRTVLPR